MSSFKFSKMHGAGNDFVVTDCFPEFNGSNSGKSLNALVKDLCDRHRGIGADGLIFLQREEVVNLNYPAEPCFTMTFFNNDGSLADMCGNGLRCASYYAWNYMLGANASKRRITFHTGAGYLRTELLSNNRVKIEIPLKENLRTVELRNRKCFYLNTGVPHLIIPSKDIASIDITEEGAFYRYHKDFEPEGTNVDFIQLPEEKGADVLIRTYERGVEDETSACGTGIAAAGVVLYSVYNHKPPLKFKTPDNDILTIEFCSKDNIVKGECKLLLTGPVEEVLRGTIQSERILNWSL